MYRFYMFLNSTECFQRQTVMTETMSEYSTSSFLCPVITLGVPHDIFLLQY